MDKTQDALKLAREALELAQDNLRDHGDNCFLHDEGEYNRCFCGKDSLSNHLQSVVEKLDEALAEQPAQQQEPVSLKSLAQKAGINLPETYIPTMDDAIAAGDSVLMNEQAALLRECRAALDSLIAQKPTLAGLLCGSTTLGNLKAELGAYRPQGVFGTSPQPAQQQEPVAWVCHGVNDQHDVDFYENEINALPVGTMLYTSPPAQRKPLTDEQIGDLWNGHTVPVFGKTGINPIVFARAIEAAHGIKGDA